MGVEEVAEKFKRVKHIADVLGRDVGERGLGKWELYIEGFYQIAERAMEGVMLVKEIMEEVEHGK